MADSISSFFELIEGKHDAGMPPKTPNNNAALAASLVVLIGACAALPYFLSRGPSEGRRVIILAVPIIGSYLKAFSQESFRCELRMC